MICSGSKGDVRRLIDYSPIELIITLIRRGCLKRINSYRRTELVDRLVNNHFSLPGMECNEPEWILWRGVAVETIRFKWLFVASTAGVAGGRLSALPI